MFQIIIILLISYLLGSIPFGLVITRLVKGIDIRQHGSGNIGATNVLRVVGKRWGIMVFLLDFLKGFILPIVIHSLDQSLPTFILLLSALFSISGHNWSVFLKFKGGKGVATSLGAMTALAIIFPYLWISLLFSFFVWVLLFLCFRYVSLSSLAAAITFSISSFAFSLPLEIKIIALFLAFFIIIRHKENILRLFTHQEHKF